MEETRAQREVREARENLDQGEAAAVEEAKMVGAELSALNPNIEIDAKEFGEHVRNGGWRLGLLVARSVAESEGQGTRSDLSTLTSGKISANSFARQAGHISRNTVIKYVTAWGLAADDGHVPPAAALSPGQGFDFDEETHTPKLWKGYFKPFGDVPGKIINPFDVLEKVLGELGSLTADELERFYRSNKPEQDQTPQDLLEAVRQTARQVPDKLLWVESQIELAHRQRGHDVTTEEDDDN